MIHPGPGRSPLNEWRDFQRTNGVKKKDSDGHILYVSPGIRFAGGEVHAIAHQGRRAIPGNQGFHGRHLVCRNAPRHARFLGDALIAGVAIVGR